MSARVTCESLTRLEKCFFLARCNLSWLAPRAETVPSCKLSRSLSQAGLLVPEEAKCWVNLSCQQGWYPRILCGYLNIRILHISAGASQYCPEWSPLWACRFCVDELEGDMNSNSGNLRLHRNLRSMHTSRCGSGCGLVQGRESADGPRCPRSPHIIPPARPPFSLSSL